MEFFEVVKARTATRKFDGRPVEEAALDKILEAGRLAPTAKNNQPVKVFVIQSAEGLAKVDKVTPCRYEAATALLVCGRKAEAVQKEEHNTAEMDACIVATHMMLAATAAGVDNIWLENVDRAAAVKEFALPEDLSPICMLPMGYRAADCPENPKHSQRKSKEELFEFV